MARNNPLYAAMLQKVRDRKRRAERAKARQKDQHGPIVAATPLEGAQDPKTLNRHFQLQGARNRHKAKQPPAKKGRTEEDPPKAVLPDLPPRQKNDPMPPKMVKPDELRGQNHYQALEAVKPKGEGRGRRLLKPVMGMSAFRKPVESRSPVLATTLAATPRKQAPTPLSRAEIDAIDVYLGVSRQTGHDLI